MFDHIGHPLRNSRPPRRRKPAQPKPPPQLFEPQRPADMGDSIIERQILRKIAQITPYVGLQYHPVYIRDIPLIRGLLQIAQYNAPLVEKALLDALFEAPLAVSCHSGGSQPEQEQTEGQQWLHIHRLVQRAQNTLTRQMQHAAAAAAKGG